jgi:hypothetical protein
MYITQHYVLCILPTQCMILTINDHYFSNNINPLDAELNPICHLVALLGAHHILHVSKIRVNLFVFVMRTCCVLWGLGTECVCIICTNCRPHMFNSDIDATGELW